MDAAGRRKLYRDFARRAAAHWHFGYDLYPDEKRLFDSHITDGPVLDAGCGVGRSFAYFEARGLKVIGLDVLPEMLERARGQGPPAEPVQGELADVGRLFRKDYFGAAVCIGNTISGLVEDGERRSFLGGVQEILAPGGVFIIDCALAETILAIAKGLDIVLDNRASGGGVGCLFQEELGGRTVQCYQYYCSEAEFTSMLEDAGFGFELEKIDTYAPMIAAVCRSPLIKGVE